MEKIKAGIIGTGGISRFHMGGYKQLADFVDVVAVCDIDEAKVKAYAEAYNVPRYYTDYNEMMAKEQLDCVSVTTWNSAHKGATIAALKGGANVLCEKPMAMNAQEAKEMLDTAKETGKLLQIGFVRRFGKDAETLKDYAESGYFGDIYYSKVAYLRKDGCPGGWFGDKEFSGGGPLIDLGVHVIDFARYIAGCPKPVSAYGVKYNNLGPHRASGGAQSWSVESNGGHPFNVEDFTSAMVKFDNGFTLVLETSFNLNLKSDKNSIELFGTKAGASLAPGFEFYTQQDGHYVNLTPPLPNTDFAKMFSEEIKGFVEASVGLTPCRAPAEDGYVLMKIIDAIYESAEKGNSVDIKFD